MIMTFELSHSPVLLEEAIGALKIERGGRYIDCTVNGGGHAAAIMEECTPGGVLLGIDADPSALKIARERLRSYGTDVILVNENFKYLESIAGRCGFRPVNGIIFDLGMSSLQLEDPLRGFSFQHDSPLDMRFSPNQAVTAADIVNSYGERELAQLQHRQPVDLPHVVPVGVDERGVAEYRLVAALAQARGGRLVGRHAQGVQHREV